MTLMRKDILHEIALDLLGTTQDLVTVAARYGLTKLGTQDLYHLAFEAFRCDDCGRWYETSERNTIDGFDFCDRCLEESYMPDDPW